MGYGLQGQGQFIQSALREWAYGWTYQNSNHRAMALASWQHHSNCHRPHSGMGGLPSMPRIGRSDHNVLTLHNRLASAQTRYVI